MDEKSFVEGWAWLLQLVAAFGTALFLVVLTVTWVAEPQLRATAHEYLVREVTERVEEKLGQDVGGVLEAASKLSKLVDKEADGTADRLKAVVPPLVNRWLSEHCDCELTQSQAKWVETVATENAVEWSKPWVERLRQQAEGLKDFAQGHYDERWSALLMDLRIFSFSNAALFLFSFLILRFRPLRAGLVVWPLSLLTLATLGAVYYWVAGQNWFWVILTNDYLGWGYLGVVGVLFAVLAHAGRADLDA